MSVKLISVITTFIALVTGDFRLTIVHDNDIHAHFQQMNVYGGRCKENEAKAEKCYGGVARMAHTVSAIRRNESNVLYLNAGDWYQGTMWYSVIKWEVIAKFMKLLNYDAMSLGNHEFDGNIDGITDFLTNVSSSFSVLAANIDDSKVPDIQNKYRKSVVLEVGKHKTKVGIIGYITPATKWISNPGDLEFVDEITAVNEEAQQMKKDGVKIIIALGHSGFRKDKEIAKKSPEVDIVVGGHTNTFLYTGDPPSIERPQGEYPFVVTQTNGKKVPVVQDFAYGKYLGYINLNFDDDGNVRSWSGNPILLDSSISEDEEIKKELEPYAKRLAVEGKKQIGKTKVFLSASWGMCHRGECNIGNFLADSMVNEFVNKSGPGEWTAAALAIQNAGGIRASVAVTDEDDEITVEDVLAVAPFQNTIDLVTLRGKYVREMLEYSVRQDEPGGETLSGSVMQVSGFQVKYDLTQPSFHRISEVLVRCKRCLIPKFEPLQDDQNYTIAMPNFLVNGGDKFTMIKDNKLDHFQGSLDQEVIVKYIQKMSPITQGLEGRIIFLDSPPAAATSLPIVGSLCMLVFSALTTLLK